MSVAVAEIGHNQPPEPTPFECVKSTIDDLMVEARNWLDGGVVTTQAEADAVSKLLDEVRKAEAAADAARIEENAPFDNGKAAVQERYAPLIANTKSRKGLTVMMIEGCKKALAPYLQKLDEEKRAVAERARKEAEAKGEAARAAMREADSLDIAARAKAEELAEEAKRAERIATKAENDKAAGRGGSRAVTLRSVWRAEMTDRNAAVRHFWKAYPEGFDPALQAMATAAVRDGARDIPGFNVIEERVAQ